MQAVRMFWLAMNSKEMLSTMEARRKFRDQLENVMLYFDKWKGEIERDIDADVETFRKRYPLATPKMLDRRRTAIRNVKKLRFITRESYSDLSLICNGLPDFLDYIYGDLKLPFTFRLNAITQDRLEGDFSILRTRAGSGMNPSVFDAMYALKSLNVSRLAGL
jgi:hypothetical protein